MKKSHLMIYILGLVFIVSGLAKASIPVIWQADPNGSGVVTNNNRRPVNEQVIDNLQNVNSNGQPQRKKFVPPQNNETDQYYQNLQEVNNKRNSVGMADAMAHAMGQPQGGQSLQQPTSQQMSPNYLVEQVNNAVHTYMTTNMNAVLEQAVKNTMMEIYEKEKIKIALEENK